MDQITKEVNEMYEKYPYPSIACFKDVDLNKHANKVLSSLGKTVDDFSLEDEILDIGCGTGEITCSLALNASVTAVDLCRSSLERAKKLAVKNKIKNINFVKENVLDLDLRKKFDYVFSYGVLHHTSNPNLAFKHAARHLKEKGFITIGLYNSFGRVRHRIRKSFLNTLAGKSIEKRIELAEKFLGMKAENEIERIYLADKFANPNERYFAMETVLNWFNENNIDFYGCNPGLKTYLGKNPLSKANLFLNQLEWMKNERTFFIVSGRKC